MNKENYVITIRNKKYKPVKIEQSKKNPDRLSITYYVDSINNTILRDSYVMTMVNTYKSYVPDMVIRSNAFVGCIEITFDYIPICKEESNVCDNTCDDNLTVEFSYEPPHYTKITDDEMNIIACDYKTKLENWIKSSNDSVIKAYHDNVGDINDP